LIAAKTHSRFILVNLFILIVFQLLPLQPAAIANNLTSKETDDTHDLLQKSLSLIEIDKEITRIQEQKELAMEQLNETKKQLLLQEEQIANKREQAGRVMRAYYMGDRNLLWIVLTAADSLPKLLQALDFMDLVYTSDKQALDAYSEQFKELQSSYQNLELKNNELTILEQRLLMQRERVVALEAQMESQLAGRSDADRLRMLMKELTSHWETEGMEEVNTYFRALSKAMQQLPAWIQENPDMIDISGFKYTITVTEEELNQFLREQDEMFEHFSFTFSDNSITAQGKRDNMEVSVSGHYSLQEKPRSGFIFHVDELLFNGFSLPDTTRKALEKEYDLGFYPELIVSFMKAKAVEIKHGELIIVLNLSL